MSMALVRINLFFGLTLQKVAFSPFPSLILGGDLNLTLSSDEHWGAASLSGSGINLYRDLFQVFESH
jgi:hypothetical protein